MKKITLILVLLASFVGKAQHTFSIVAVDPVTGEVGSAGATCGDSIIWPGTAGAILISDIIPGVGAIHTQSYHDATNQTNARYRMTQGDSPEQIVNWLVANDVSSNPAIRQYGVVDYNGGNPRSAAYTGSNCFNYKNHILGPNYAVQGNILLGQQILDSMESRFNRTEGCLSDKLMAAMQGAKVIGADTRCTSEGTSSLSAFLRVAQPTDQSDALTLDLNVAGTATGVEPIEVLQNKYDNWKLNHQHNCGGSSVGINEGHEQFEVELYPNPTSGLIHVKIPDGTIGRVVVADVFGKVMHVHDFSGQNELERIALSTAANGVYFVNIYSEGGFNATKKVLVQPEF